MACMETGEMSNKNGTAAAGIRMLSQSVRNVISQ